MRMVKNLITARENVNPIGLQVNQRQLTIIAAKI